MVVAERHEAGCFELYEERIGQWRSLPLAWSNETTAKGFLNHPELTMAVLAQRWVFDQRSVFDRMTGAAALDPVTYEEVKKDDKATGEAVVVVVIVAICSAIGAFWHGALAIAAAPISAILTWLVWTAITYVIGDKLLGSRATWPELLRTIGFAQSPGVFMILGVIPILGGLLRLIVAIWMLVAGIVAIRTALSFSTGKAVLTALLCWGVLMGLAYITRGGDWFRM